MKTAIVYYSKHHGNTEKVLKKIAETEEVTLIDVTKETDYNLSSFERIGFASGIYYSKFHKSLLKYAAENMPKNKQTFFIYTYGAKKDGYTAAIRQALADKNAIVLGEYGCLGFDSFGPFKLIGGIAQNHPDEADFKNALIFYCGLEK